MKNPLFVIQGNLQMMALNKSMESEDRSEVYTQRIARSSRSLLRMILNLLDISRLEQQQMEIEPVPVDLNILINEIVSGFKDIPEHESKSVQLKLKENISQIYVDKELFERILDNLMNYVFKNTPDKQSVLVETKELDDHRLRLKISHDGTPVPGDFKKKIFLKHFQSELKKAGFKPARGLGLLFCKLAMEAQDGTIVLDPQAKDFNRFILEMPTMKFMKKNNGK
jgi:two-component system sensor histidine kinase/response regulator